MPGEPTTTDLGLGANIEAPHTPPPPPDSNGALIESLTDQLGPQEGSSNTDIFWEGNGIVVTMPEKPIVPREEGLSFMVTSQDASGTWKDRKIKDVLSETYYSLPVARILSESLKSDIPDYWANIQLKSAEGFEQGVNVIGRNPHSETGWAKPPVVGDVAELEPLPNSEKIRELMSRYIPLWDERQIALFPDGVNEVPDESEEFRKISESYPGDVLWMNDKFILDVVRRPHLSGIHIVVSQRDKAKELGAIKKPWQVSSDPREVPVQRQAFMEEMAIILSAQRVLWEEGVPYYNPEIQFNSNWASSMQPEDKGGSLDPNSLDTIAEKRVHRQHREKEFQTSTHGHLYATSSPDENVSLPARPEAEVPEEWLGIKPAQPEEVVRLRSILQAKLAPYLAQNVRGSI